MDEGIKLSVCLVHRVQINTFVTRNVKCPFKPWRVFCILPNKGTTHTHAFIYP